MLDLDSLDTLLEKPGSSNLYIIFAQWLCLEKISYVEFQKLSKWTNTYEYILPAYREMDAGLLGCLFLIHRSNLFFLALLVSHLEANLRPEYQLLLLRMLNESKLVGKNRLPDGGIA